MPTRPETSQSCGRAAGTLPASDPQLRPCSPPSEDTANKPDGYAIDRAARRRVHRLAGQAGLHPARPSLRLHFVSFGPRYPSGRILHCDASATPEVVLRVSCRTPLMPRTCPGGRFAVSRDVRIAKRFGNVVRCIVVGIAPRVQSACASLIFSRWRRGNPGLKALLLQGAFSRACPSTSLRVKRLTLPPIALRA